MTDNVALTPHSSGKRQNTTLVVRLPVALSRALIQAGYNRVKLTVNDEGILLRPYIAEDSFVQGGVAAIPDWTAK